MWPDAEQDSHLQSALTRRVTVRTQTRCLQMAVSHEKKPSWPIQSRSRLKSCWFRQSLNQSVKQSPPSVCQLTARRSCRVCMV